MDKIQALMDRYLTSKDASDPRERKRRRIILAASDHFTRHGFRKANMEEIAKSAGVAKGTLYLYFKDKADLLTHAIAQEKSQYMTRILAILQEELPAQDRLRRWLREIFLVTHEMPLVSRLISGDREIFDVLEEIDADIKEHALDIQQSLIAAFLDQAARPHRWTASELDERARVLVAVMYAAGAFSDERARQGLTLDRFAELLASMLVDGAAGPATAAPQTRGGQS